jgi:putative tryptophan/tyrosine transport system substrate-binding protein
MILSSWSRAARSFFGFALSTAIVFLCTPAQSQQRKGLPKIGWLSALTSSNAGQEEIIAMLRELGYVKGKNIDFEFRYAANRLDRLPALAKDLVAHGADLLITPGTPSTLALRDATKTIPIVFLDVTDPVASGLVHSLARPGGNITGFTSIESVLAGKRLELLKETVSKLLRVAVLWDPQNPGAQQEWKASQVAARDLGLQLHSMEVSSLDEYEKAFSLASKAHSAALTVLSTPLTNSSQRRIAELAAKNRLPSIYNRKEFVAQGGLMSYGVDQTERFRRAAVLIDKILRGIKPADIPVEQPTKFELAINLKAANQIGLTIPPNVLARAERVIR